MRKWRQGAILGPFLLAIPCASLPGRTMDAPIVLQNKYFRLSFDRASGGWVEWLDLASGRNLLVDAPLRAVLGVSVPKPPNGASIRRAIDRGDAVSLEGQWVFAPGTSEASEAGALLKGRFDVLQWHPTPIPSVRGAGDDRLHNRIGNFWYRTQFSIPHAWAGRNLVLLIGSVDDFDTTYVNGVEVGSTGPETPHHWEVPRRYSVPARVLRPDRPNVLLIKVTNGAYDGGIGGPVAIGVSPALRGGEAPISPLSAFAVRRSREGTTLELTTRSDGWEYTLRYVVPPRRPWILRQLFVRNVGSTSKTLSATSLCTPPIRVGPDEAIAFPGSLPVGDSPVNRMLEGGAIAPRSQDPLAILWSARDRCGVGTWFHCEEEYTPVSVVRRGDGAEIRHTQNILAPLKPGEGVALGVQYLWLMHGTRDAVLRGVQSVYSDIGLKAPSRGLPRLSEQVMYCGHPGGTPEMNFRGYGGFNRLREYVPVLKRMGITLLWLLPIWEHGDGTRWNLYSPFDHFKISPLYGTPEELKELSATCAQAGIRLIFDLVPHGPPDITPLARDHPDWICRNPDGSAHYKWGQVSFDYANPGWQDYMRRVAAWDAREYGAVGARVDVAAGSPVNWQPVPGKRPSFSTLGGGLAMDHAIRQGFLQVHPYALLLPEEYTGANIFYRDADLTYDAQLYFLMMDLQDRNAAPAEWARALQQFLHDQALTLPPGALKMRWISNHDTVSWTFQKKRPLQVYGLQKMHALMALCALIDGVPMLYQGDEDPSIYKKGVGPSSVEFLRRIYGLKRRIPALARGSCDTGGVAASGGVFACLRKAGRSVALVLISFNAASVRSTVRLLSGSGKVVWEDAMGGERIVADGPFRVTMGPYQVRVLVRRAGG
ncbi:MAG: alpha-amylase family glycosyl hydrolase [Chthonomonadales bacterium]